MQLEQRRFIASLANALRTKWRIKHYTPKCAQLPWAIYPLLLLVMLFLCTGGFGYFVPPIEGIAENSWTIGLIYIWPTLIFIRAWTRGKGVLRWGTLALMAGLWLSIPVNASLNQDPMMARWNWIVLDHSSASRGMFEDELMWSLGDREHISYWRDEGLYIAR